MFFFITSYLFRTISVSKGRDDLPQTTPDASFGPLVVSFFFSFLFVFYITVAKTTGLTYYKLDIYYLWSSFNLFLHVCIFLWNRDSKLEF